MKYIYFILQFARNYFNYAKGVIFLKEQFLKHLAGFSGCTLPQLQAIFSKPAYRGIRLNPLKATPKVLQAGFRFLLEPTPFCQNAYYLPPTYQGIGHHPLHHAGAFYVQEPSAGSVITAVAAQPGQRVLDLCAAPGGKSTGIGALLAGKGQLWSNEFVKGRTGALLSNLERFGIANAVVTSMNTANLCAALPEYFDTVLVDAPCSGEGMCRHNPEALRQWSLQNIALCVPRQREILTNALAALKPGGKLVYSTCTFNLQENEENVAWLISTFSNLKIQNVNFVFGQPGYGKFPFANNVRRIFPTNGGEGHFLAVFQKEDSFKGASTTLPGSATPPKISAAQKLLWQTFFSENLSAVPAGEFRAKNNRLYLVPAGLPQLPGGVLRAGLLLGEFKQNRFEPAHALFTCPLVKPLQSLELSLSDPRLSAFLHGQEISAQGLQKGFVRVTVSGVPLGFGKYSGGVLKNHYPKGLRELNENAQPNWGVEQN